MLRVAVLTAVNQIVGVAAREEVGGGLQTNEAVVAPDETVVCVAIAELGQRDQKAILDLRFRVRVMRDSCHEQILSCGYLCRQPQNCSVAHSSPGAKARYT